jgi:predicted nucleic acid-binding protein
VRRRQEIAGTSSLRRSLQKLSPAPPASTTSASELTSTPSSIKTPCLATWSSRSEGLIDTSVAVDPGAVASLDGSIALAISAVTLAELAAGPHAAQDELTRTRRRNHLLSIERTAPALPFDANCAHAWARIYAAVERVGRKPRGARALDLMIAATAFAHDLPLYTLNADDLRGLEGLIEIVDVGA